MLNGPLKNGCAAGKVGLVLGCGPGLDLLPDDAFRIAAESNGGFVSIGTNRILGAKKITDNKYHPDILIVWDGCVPDLPKCQDIEQMFVEAKGKSWRLVVANTKKGGVNYSHDQLIPRNDSANGIENLTGEYRDGDIEKSGCWLTNSCGDAAINLLWRMGIRKMYIAGIDGYGGYCQWGGFKFRDLPASSHWQNKNNIDRVLLKWKRIVDGYEGKLEMYNTNPEAVMVKCGLMPYGVPKRGAA